MPAAITPPDLFWQVHQPPPTRSGAANPGSRPGAEPQEDAWRSRAFSSEPARPGRRRATRYERFTTRMVLLSSVLMLGVTACLHVFNYGLETKTSSTSGTHSGFYKEGE